MGIILNMPDYKIRLVGGTVGGGFGGKVDVVIEPVTAIAAMKTGRPVKWRWTRTEEFRNSSTVGMYRMTYTDGVMNDGRIIARKVISYHDAGAYHRHSPYGVQKHAFNLGGPYNIPNVYIAAHCVYTNRQPSSALRGFGVTPASFAIEVQMDKIARTLGMDPWQIRFLNAYRNGQMKAVRKEVEDATLIETMQAGCQDGGRGIARVVPEGKFERRRTKRRMCGDKAIGWRRIFDYNVSNRCHQRRSTSMGLNKSVL